MSMMTRPVASDADLTAILQKYNDVTERLKRSHDALAREVCRLREQLHEKNRELERSERLASLGQMAAGVAHEIRNPLGGIGLYVSLLERDLADRPEQVEIVRKVLRGVRNLESIVGDILAFAGEVEPRRHRERVGDIVEAALLHVRPQAESAGIDIECEIDRPSTELWCDARQIQRALMNLLLNATEAVDREGKVWLRIDSSANASDYVRLVVEDDGPGIAPSMLQRVFDPFFTAKDGGTGLGLAIVHRMAESNGGSVSAGVRSEGGARFVLTVPRARADHDSLEPGGN